MQLADGSDSGRKGSAVRASREGSDAEPNRLVFRVGPEKSNAERRRFVVRPTQVNDNDNDNLHVRSHPSRLSSSAVTPANRPRFSEEATAEYGMAVTRYSEDLEALSTARCGAEMVLVSHVRDAVKELGPSSGGERFKTVLDWCKRFAFLALGLTIAQGNNVMKQEPIARGSVGWLVAGVLVTSLLIGVALAMDLPAVKGRLAGSG